MSLYTFFAQDLWSPVILPTAEQHRLWLAQSMINRQIADEVEVAADQLWQTMLQDEALRTMSVEQAEIVCAWWFRFGYSEHLRRQVATLQPEG